MSNDSTKKRPAYRIYAINRREGRKNQWFPVGAAWAQADGRGFSLDFGARPFDGSDIVLREVRDDGETQEEGGAQ